MDLFNTINRVVCDVRQSYPDMEMEEAIDYVHDTVDRHNLDDSDYESYEAYRLVLNADRNSIHAVIAAIRRVIRVLNGDISDLVND